MLKPLRSATKRPVRYYAKVSAVRLRQAGDRIAELVTVPERPPGRTDSIMVSPRRWHLVMAEEVAVKLADRPNGDMLFAGGFDLDRFA
ncbi:hypothetical protein [Actinoplanes derwentensis]|uniref:hypothetical protein n=1 Tax=Actinoplanes derwentensis TaxID=113562 RepID=UPI0012FDFB53|nr:hypothetical protein [Actinoplanes derwentensis]GID90587.1 hypothetical protein Ade03nite_95110 [Actinoplanes derwentensis]